MNKFVTPSLIPIVVFSCSILHLTATSDGLDVLKGVIIFVGMVVFPVALGIWYGWDLRDNHDYKI